MIPTAWTARWRQEGGAGELLRLALPLIVSNSFWTLQITIDRVLLSRSSSDAVAAAMPAVFLFWTPLALLQNTAGYSTTFVAQYLGAGRPQRIGPVVWQALHFSLLGGVAFLALLPLAEPLVSVTGHPPHIQEMEAVFLRCLCFSALPTLITAAASGFFSGRGDSWTVLLINGVGLGVNAVLDYAWIFGRWGFPAWGIAGAGWATVAGASASAVLAVALMLRRRYRAEFATLRGWRPDTALLGRLLWFGLPNGLQWALDGLAWTVFTVLVGRLGADELAATSIAFTINLVGILPMFGVAQAVSILVGQRLGEDRAYLAERTTWTGLGLAGVYVAVVCVLYLAAPGMFLALFREGDAAQGERVTELVPVLLRFVALYCLFDAGNLVFSMALRGAGDTRFVTAVSLGLAWPMLVLPSWAAWYYGWGLYWMWAFASAYIIALTFVFLFRFRAGKWKAMRVIETLPTQDGPSANGFAGPEKPARAVEASPAP
jgi:multidrug resistance protein, MATE family